MQVYNSMTGGREQFVPFDVNHVRMYVCGPTVYDRAHLGNARSAVVFDMVYRFLRFSYGIDSVTYARNFTDVDDKIMVRAQETGRDIQDITQETIGWYHQDMDALSVLRPDHEPRATRHINDMIQITNELMSSGAAYQHSGHVMFNINSFAEYGKLSGRSANSIANIDHPELSSYKVNPGDFVLWKPSDDSQPGWPSPWGRGRPGWHVECSAMARHALGNHIDIHGGGIDLKFPHHENEIAQSECANGHQFGKYWMHNEMVTNAGKKMSKSAGNVVLVNKLLNEFNGSSIRYLLLGTHYRKPLDFTLDRLQSAEKELSKWNSLVLNLKSGDIDPELVNNLANDFNTPGAVGVLRKLFKEQRGPELRAGMEMMGII